MQINVHQQNATATANNRKLSWRFSRIMQINVHHQNATATADNSTLSWRFSRIMQIRKTVYT
jgi:hypothetical protein